MGSLESRFEHKEIVVDCRMMVCDYFVFEGYEIKSRVVVGVLLG